jgi:uncharacterized membrane protein
MSNLNFLHAEYFWLLLPFVILLFISAARSFKRQASVIKDYRWLLKYGLQLLIFTSVLIALARPYFRSELVVQDLQILLDCSESLDSEKRVAVLEKITDLLDRRGQVNVIAFAANVANSQVVHSVDLARSLKKLCSRVDTQEGTNIESALNFAIESGSSRLFLVSDGNETTGSVDTWLQANSERSTVYSFAVGVSKQKFPTISGFRLPQSSLKGQTIESQLYISGIASDREVVVKMFQNDQEISSALVSSEKLSTVNLKSKELRQDVEQFRVELIDVKTGKILDRKVAYTAVSKSEQLLVLSGVSGEARTLVRLLDGLGKNFDSILLDQAERPTKALEDYSFVIINNAAFNQLPADLAQQLPEFVAKGGKLLMIGGNQSFGLGGYKGTEIEKILPVRLVDPQKELKRLNVAVELVLDKSGSMKDSGKIEFTRLAAEGVIDSLKSGDYLGIIGFDSQPFVVLPLGRIDDIRQKAKERIQLLFPRGNTQLLPALDIAHQELARVSAGRKHVVVLTDGRLPDEYAMRDIYLQMVRRMSSLGTTLSTFLVGGDYSALLKDIAQSGGGAFYQAVSAEALPRLFLEDLKVAVGERTQKENSVFKVKLAKDAAQFASLGSYPNLLGLVETRSRDNTVLHLSVQEGEKEFPLLASRAVGQGKTIAFTSDASGRWNQLWQNWERFYDFWTLIFSGWVEGGEGASEAVFNLMSYVQGDDLKLELSIFTKKLAENFSTQLITPDLKTLTLDFYMITPGRYQAIVPKAQSGSYAFSLLGAGNKSVGTRVFDVTPEQKLERAAVDVDLELLERVSNETGGKVSPNKTDLQSRSKNMRTDVDLTDWFLILAGALLLLHRFLSIRRRLI